MPNVYTTTLVKYMYCTFCILLVVQPCCFQQNSCLQNATRRGPQTATIVFDITCGIGDFRAHFFSASLRRLKTCLRSTMNQNRLNNCLLPHCHKSITDTLDTVDIAKKFVRANEQRKRHFGKY